jgi:hypothetical protein
MLTPFFIDAGKASGRNRGPGREPVMAGAGRSVPGGWTAAAGLCFLMVALYVAEPTTVSLTVGDHVRLDRVTGASAQRYGGLIQPGSTPVHLAAGTYVFRTTRDARVQLGEHARVRVLAVTQAGDKQGGPIELGAAQGLPELKGDSLPDHVPALTVLR